MADHGVATSGGAKKSSVPRWEAVLNCRFEKEEAVMRYHRYAAGIVVSFLGLALASSASSILADQTTVKTAETQSMVRKLAEFLSVPPGDRLEFLGQESMDLASPEEHW
jgi:hypothetical protein